MNQIFYEKILQMIEDDIKAVDFEMKELDRRYVERERHMQKLKTSKLELEAMMIEDNSTVGI